jgi:hypothetical protein
VLAVGNHHQRSTNQSIACVSRNSMLLPSPSKIPITKVGMPIARSVLNFSRCVGNEHRAVKNCGVLSQARCLGRLTDADRSMPTVASLSKANAAVARGVRAFLFSSDKTPVLRSSRRDSGASFCSNHGNFVCPEKLAVLPELPKCCFTKRI